MVMGLVRRIRFWYLSAWPGWYYAATSRFGPWLTGSLWLLLATGILMVVGERARARHVIVLVEDGSGGDRHGNRCDFSNGAPLVLTSSGETRWSTAQH